MLLITYMKYPLLLLPLLLISAKPTTSEILDWDYAAAATNFVLEQCVNSRGGCSFAVVQVIDGQVRTYTVTMLDRHKSYCWRLRTGEVISNTVCS